MTVVGHIILDEAVKQMKLLCFGDSNTYGYDPRSYFGGRYEAAERWVDLLAQKLDGQAVNAGENGREIPRWAEEWAAFGQLLTRERPDWLLILLGSNDLLQGNPVKTVVERMERFLQQIELEKDKILLLAPPLMVWGEWVTEQSLIDASQQLNQAYQDLAERLAIRFVNVGKIPLCFDGVHFTADGHRLFSERLSREWKP